MRNVPSTTSTSPVYVEFTALVSVTAFNSSEYLSVRYYDYKSMGFLTKTFYVGDRSVTSINRRLGISTLEFNIIEQ